MANARGPAVLFGVVVLLVNLTAAADSPKGTIRVEAVVQNYETAVMEDFFDDGRFAVYDAVTLRMVSPAEMVDKTIRVHVAIGSIAIKSPLRKPGERYHFDFDKELLREGDLFWDALENLQWAGANGATKLAGLNKIVRPIDPKVLAAIEKELVRLQENAKRETGPNFPRPSSQVAYYLLAGLAERGVLIKKELPESERRLFYGERRGGYRAKLIAVFTDVRVARTDYAIQDKAGSYVHRTAALYVKKNGKWSKKGNAAIAEVDLPAP